MSRDPPRDRAKELFSRARDDPAAVDPADLRELLDADDEGARWYAVQSLRATANGGELDLAEFAPALLAELDADSSRLRSEAAMALGDVAADSPVAVTDAVDRMADRLDADQGMVRTAAVDFLYRVAAAAAEREVAPSALDPAIDDLRALVRDGDGTRRKTAVVSLAAVTEAYADRLAADADAFLAAFEDFTGGGEHVGTREIENPETLEQLRESASSAELRDRQVRNAAAHVLVGIARERPERLESEIETLADYLDDPNPVARRDVLQVMEAVGGETPTVLEPHLSAIAEGLDDHEGIRERAALALVAASQATPAAVGDVVEPHVEAVVGLLDHDEPAVRGGAVGLLSYVVEERPDAVDAESVVPLLDDDHAYVRGNAVWVIGALEAESAAERVREMADVDPDPSVREAAEAALERL